MKSITLLTILFFGQTIIWASEKKTIVNSKINKVTVYQQGAKVSRKANYSASKGINKIIIQGVSSQIDYNSIQVSTTGNAILLDSKYKLFYPEVPENNNTPSPIIQKKINAIQDSLFELTYIIQALQYKIDVLNSEKQILSNNGTIKGVGKVNDSIPLLKEAMAYYHLKMNQINTELLKLTKSKTLLKRKENEMQNRLSNYQLFNANHNPKNDENYQPIHQIEITLSANEATQGRIFVSYLVNNAGWIPQYDLRNQTENNTINLTYKAQVYQNTGVEWDNVKLNLSTNNPYANKTKPELSPWYLNYNTYANQNRNAPTKTLEYKKMRPLAAQANSEKITENDEALTVQKDLTSADFTTVINQLLSVEYSIDLPYTISSNNEKYMVLVNEKTLKTNYKYYTVPKLDLACYLVAQITNLDDLNIAPGKANIFHNNAYLGTTYLNPSIMGDTMNLSLGQDPKLMVKRTLLKKESKAKVVGDKIVKTYAYLMEVKNHKNNTIRITLQDQIPISQNKAIEIELINGSKGKLNEVTGFLEWDLKLKSKETKNINLVYTVKYDKTQQINLTEL
jgi:uncharacterized protein (TIGR02231 family)